MEVGLKRILRGISLELRHTLEGWHDKKTGAWNPGDLERRLNEIGAWGDRPSKPLDEMPHLSAEDKAARRLVDGYLQLRAEAGVERAAAVAEFVRESAYTLGQPVVRAPVHGGAQHHRGSHSAKGCLRGTLPRPSTLSPQEP